MKSSGIAIRIVAVVLISVMLLGIGHAAEGWPSEVAQVSYRSSADNTDQPALFYAPPDNSPKPLLVALHTWSSDCRQPESIVYAHWCLTHGWAFIHPDFRGPNVRRDATGSELAIQDVMSSVEYARLHANVDDTRIYLVGFSGGGYLSLLVAGRYLETWAGVSAWNPIADLNTWYSQSKKAGNEYAEQIAASCGGIPEAGTPAGRECAKRSPLTYLARARNTPFDLNAGVHDGHAGPVPISHSLEAFNLLAAESDQLTPADIDSLTNLAIVPSHLRSSEEYPSYGNQASCFEDSREASG